MLFKVEHKTPFCLQNSEVVRMNRMLISVTNVEVFRLGQGRLAGSSQGRNFCSKMTAKYTIVLVRHGESEYNKENRFCGWYDADLSATGLEEAKNAGKVCLQI